MVSVLLADGYPLVRPTPLTTDEICLIGLVIVRHERYRS